MIFKKVSSRVFVICTANSRLEYHTRSAATYITLDVFKSMYRAANTRAFNKLFIKK